MAVTAYVLIQTEVGRRDIARQVAAIDRVISAEDVSGPYDVIVHTETDSLDALGRLVVGQIQTIDGIVRTITCPVMHL